jgi:hypothetical protein
MQPAVCWTCSQQSAGHAVSGQLNIQPAVSWSCSQQSAGHAASSQQVMQPAVIWTCNQQSAGHAACIQHPMQRTVSWHLQFYMKWGAVVKTPAHNCLLWSIRVPVTVRVAYEKLFTQMCYADMFVSLCHRGGRVENINAWYLNTHMVYL